MSSGFLNPSPSPQTNYFYRWRHQDTKKKLEIRGTVKQIILLLQIRISLETEKYQVSKNRVPDDPLNTISKIMDMRSRSTKKHETDILQYVTNIF